MNVTTMFRLGVKHTRGHVAQKLLAWTGHDLTRPIIFNANVEAHCNIKCKYCACWRHEQYPEELSIEQWQAALLSVHRFVGSFAVSFTGGEPLLKPGFLDLLAWCRSNEIYGGVTTNGTLLTQANVEQLVAAAPLNVNISADAADAEVNDRLRGKSGLLEQISGGIRRLVQQRHASGTYFPIIIKPTVNAGNFRHLVQLVHWAKQIGATCVNFQPMDRWTPETYDELWIEEADIPEFQQVCDQLIQLKREGAPILNQESTIRLMVPHFREEQGSHYRCSCPMQNFSIAANGDVQICPCSPVVGNLQQHSARDIWYGSSAAEFRTSSHEQGCLNLNTSATPKTLPEKLKMGFQLLRG